MQIDDNKCFVFVQNLLCRSFVDYTRGFIGRFYNGGLMRRTKIN